MEDKEVLAMELHNMAIFKSGVAKLYDELIKDLNDTVEDIEDIKHTAVVLEEKFKLYRATLIRMGSKVKG